MRAAIFTLTTAVLLAVSMLLPAQTPLFFNGGDTVAVTGGGILYVDGTIDNASGLFSNAGSTYAKLDYVNNDLTTGGGANGVYYVYRNWVNNANFTADQSNVDLAGNSQLITGTQVTTFHDLTLETGGSRKTQTLDANVNHLLSLNDCELFIGDNRTTVTNPVNASVARLNGFVSSTGPGRFIRYTNSANTYLFPTGWNDNGNILYRPVEITPSVTDAQQFELRMGFGDPTLEGYDTTLRDRNVLEVNAKFWHLIKQVGSTAPSDLSIYYDMARDGQWSSIGRFESTPAWTDLTNTTFTQAFPLSHQTKAGWTDNGREPHALINTKPIDFVYNWPNVFDPNSNDPNNATFHVIDQFNLVTVQELKIFDRWGEVVFDSQRDGRTDWDGKYHGKLQLMGNYVWMAKVKINSSGEVKASSGDLALIW